MDWPSSFPSGLAQLNTSFGVLTGSSDKFHDRGANIPPKLLSQSVLSHWQRDYSRSLRFKAIMVLNDCAADLGWLRATPELITWIQSFSLGEMHPAEE